MFIQSQQNQDNAFGDFGRSLKKSIRKVVSAPVKAVAKVATVVTKPVVRVATGVTRPFIRSAIGIARKNPLAMVGGAILGPTGAIIGSVATKMTGASVNQGSEPVAVPDGPLVTIYAPDGSEGQIPSNYIVNGIYTADGVTWTTTAPKTVKIYSAYGDIAEVPEAMLTNGQYKDQDGNIWTTTVTVPQQIAASLAPSVSSVTTPTPAYAPDTTVAQKIADSLTPVVSVPQGQVVVPAQAVSYDGPLVTMYSSDGRVGEIPSNYIVNGQYLEDGVLWTTIPPAPKEEPLVTMYAPDGTEGQIPSNYVVNGKYTEDGVTWTIAPEKEGSNMISSASGKTIWQRIIESLASSGKSLSGIGEEDDTVSMLDRLTKQVEKGKAIATAGRKLVSAAKGKKNVPAATPALLDRPAGTQSMLGLPPAVVYGGATVSIAGLGYILYKLRKGKKR
jgi:hypothetical protein